MSETVAIRVESLSKTFGRRKKRRVEAVKRITLEVHTGQVYGFLGPNGAGKTTTIRMLLNLIHPTEGCAYIYGQNVQRNHSVLRRVGAIVEGAAFYNFLSGRRNLEVLARTANNYDPKRITALLEQVGLAGRAEHRVKGYSTGMKQRLGLAAALLSSPDLLILDEPTNGLDPSGMHEIRQFIRELADEHGKTVFLSSHLLSEVEQVCDRVAIINLGEIVREGAVTDLLEGKTQLRVEVSPADKAAQVLQEHWSLSTTMTLPAIPSPPIPSPTTAAVKQPGNSNARWLTVNASHDDAPHIVRHLVNHDIDVFQITSQRQSLEEYFLSVVREETERAAG
ncbi:MAG: ABC transporter ATP-binding protein [Anaerolineae bacterium]|nr:ABC transporter ATP-binding protein [Anaerolineae bacterium]